MGLGQDRWRSALELLREVYASCNLDEFSRRVTSGVPRLIRSKITAYTEYNPAARRIDYLVNPAEADFAGSRKIFAHHIAEHPIVAYYRMTRDGRPRTISDFLTQRQFRRSGLYNEFFRRVGVEDLMGAWLPSRPPILVSVALCRGRPDFTDQDRLLLRLLLPHLAQAYRNADAFGRIEQERILTGRSLEAMGVALIAVKRDARIAWATPRARRVLVDYFGALPRRTHRLPETLTIWLKSLSSFGGEDAVAGAPRQPLVIDRNGARLVIRHLLGTKPSLLLLQEKHTSLHPARLAHLGLTRREAEVLSWVAEGKPDATIAGILGISVRTVQKHLERIYAKLGLESRSAAAVCAHQAAELALDHDGD